MRRVPSFFNAISAGGGAPFFAHEFYIIGAVNFFLRCSCRLHGFGGSYAVTPLSSFSRRIRAADAGETLLFKEARFPGWELINPPLKPRKQTPHPPQRPPPKPPKLSKKTPPPPPFGVFLRSSSIEPFPPPSRYLPKAFFFFSASHSSPATLLKSIPLSLLLIHHSASADGSLAILPGDGPFLLPPRADPCSCLHHFLLLTTVPFPFKA